MCWRGEILGCPYSYLCIMCGRGCTLEGEILGCPYLYIMCGRGCTLRGGGGGESWGVPTSAKCEGEGIRWRGVSLRPGFHLGISSWGGSSRIMWPYGHGEGRVDFIITISGGGKWVSLGGKLSCLGGGGELPLRSPSLDETLLPLHNVWERMYTGGGKSWGVPTSA